MPIELTDTDVAVLNALLKDGRKSFRQISRETEISTPTVKTRLQDWRMKAHTLLRIGLCHTMNLHHMYRHILAKILLIPKRTQIITEFHKCICERKNLSENNGGRE